MTSQKLDLLVDALARRTAAGKIGWSQASREDSFVWSGTTGSVLLFTKDNDGLPPWILRLSDQEGRTIEEETYSNDFGQHTQIGSLYADARAEALDINATIDGLLGDLE